MHSEAEGRGREAVNIKICRHELCPIQPICVFFFRLQRTRKENYISTSALLPSIRSHDSPTYRFCFAAMYETHVPNTFLSFSLSLAYATLLQWHSEIVYQRRDSLREHEFAEDSRWRQQREAALYVIWRWQKRPQVFTAFFVTRQTKVILSSYRMKWQWRRMRIYFYRVDEAFFQCPCTT